MDSKSYNTEYKNNENVLNKMYSQPQTPIHYLLKLK